MSWLSSYILLAGRGVGGATFAIGPELTVQADEQTVLVVGAPDVVELLMSADEQTILVDTDAQDVIVDPAEGELTIE